MPAIGPQQWKQVRSVLDELDTVPCGQRRERLAAMQIDDHQVLAEIESLLDAESRQSGFLESSPYAGVDPAVAKPSLAPGTVLGAFRIDSLIGRGGMAEVYRARRLGDFEQVVAVKLIANAAHERVEYFQRERRIVAAMEHPGIARIIDGGVTETGRPYMVMEYVEGANLIVHAREHRLDLPRRLDLFRQVCEAVAFAHRQHVIHRDLKPDNIRVTPQGRVKLLDFGVAKLLDAEHRDERFETAQVFTPEFAAPEQLYGQALSPATDVYALGVVLYELLAGGPPFETRGQPLHLAIDRLLRSEAPPASRTAARQAQPPLNPALLRGDLDAIVAKAMRRRPEERYRGADELWADLERHLARTPVLARRSRPGYVLGRFLQRNRVALAAASASLLLAAVAAGALLYWLTAARPAADGETPRTVAVLPFEDLGRDADPAFADGLHEAVVAHLARIHDMHVISRGSVLKYAGAARPLTTIARELGVANLLAGTVQREGGRLRVSARLVRGDDEAPLWSRTYDRGADEVFALQAELAEQVANSVRATVLPEERERIRSRPTRSLKAYDLYLLATQQDRGSATGAWRIDDWFDAVSQLEQAVSRDPAFALAYAALAHVNVRMHWHGIDPRPERLLRAREAIESALRLAPDRGEVRFANGMYLYYGTRDLPAALRELELAREQLPGDSAVHEFVGYVLRRLGRYDEAIAELRHAMTLDPHSDRLMSGLVDTLTATRRYAEADAACERWSTFTAQPESVEVTRAENRFWWKGHLAPYDVALRRAPPALDELCWISEKRWRVSLYRRNFEQAVRDIESCAGDAVGQDAGESAPRSVYAALASELAHDREGAERRYAAASVDLEAALRRNPALAYGRVWLAYARAFAGDSAAARDEINAALASADASGDEIQKNQILRAAADFHAHVGERGRALEILELSLPHDYGVLVEEIRLDPRWRALQTDPRFLQRVAEARERIAASN